MVVLIDDAVRTSDDGTATLQYASLVTGDGCDSSGGNCRGSKGGETTLSCGRGGNGL